MKEEFKSLLEHIETPGSVVEGFELHLHPDTFKEYGIPVISSRIVLSRLYPKDKVFAVRPPRLETYPHEH